MKNPVKYSVLCVFILSALFFAFGSTLRANAEDVSEEIEEQLNNIELGDIEDYFSQKNTRYYNFSDAFKKMLSGDFAIDYDNIGEYVKTVFFEEISSLLPVIAGIVFIAFISSFLQNIRGNTLREDVGGIIKFACLSSVIILLSGEFFIVWNTVQNTIKNLSDFNEIMSPIILTLMVASGGSVSAGIYKPLVLFLTGGIVNLFYSVVIPLIGVITVIDVLSCFSSAVKLKNFSEFLTGLLKWIFGIVITVYGFFITVQGISAASFDGISIKIAKYAVGNGIPIVGGLLREGFDVVIAGSVIIKNSIGIAGILGVFYFLLSPVVFLASLSLLLKLSSAITSVFSDDVISDFLKKTSKSVTYFSVCVITVAFMTFITVLLMTFSANSVIQ